MPFNLLIFPLVGGYYFLVRSQFFRFIHQRIERQKLLLNSAIAGIGLILVSFVIKALWISLSPNSADFLKGILPLNAPNAGTMILSFFLGIGLAELLNIKLDRTYWLVYAIKEIGSELEQLLEFSANNKELIQISLKNEKVYVGWVTTLPIPQHSSYIRFSPAVSGYRDKETKRITFTDSYIEAYDRYIKNGSVTDLTTLTHLVIKMDEILTANRFNIDTYENFKDISKKKKPSVKKS
jgi:hypothetical protein